MKLVHALARLTISFVWIWQGLVPKLIFKDPDESLMLTDGGIDRELADQLVFVAGIGEVIFGLVVLIAWRSRIPLWLTAGLMVLAACGVAMTSPRYLTQAFNPMTLNVQLFALSLIALVALRELRRAEPKRA